MCFGVTNSPVNYVIISAFPLIKLINFTTCFGTLIGSRSRNCLSFKPSLIADVMNKALVNASKRDKTDSA